jgi:hypothetical protein
VLAVLLAAPAFAANLVGNPFFEPPAGNGLPVDGRDCRLLVGRHPIYITAPGTGAGTLRSRLGEIINASSG